MVSRDRFNLSDKYIWVAEDFDGQVRVHYINHVVIIPDN